MCTVSLTLYLYRFKKKDQYYKALTHNYSIIDSIKNNVFNFIDKIE